MIEAKAQIGASEEWYLLATKESAPLQPYRSAPATWPISAQELKRTEAQAATNPSALNNLGTHNEREETGRGVQTTELFVRSLAVHCRSGVAFGLGSAVRQSVQSV